MYRHFQVSDQVRVVNRNAVNFRMEGVIVATQPNEKLSEPDCTVRFADGTEHTYHGVELHRLNQTEEEVAQAAKFAAMTPDELKEWIDKPQMD